MKYRHNSILVILALSTLLLGVLEGKSQNQEFTYAVKQDRTIGKRDGHLIISAKGIEFRARKEKDSRSWSYRDIRLVEILSASDIRIWTYQNRKLLLGRDENLTFKVVDAEFEQKLSDFLRAHIDRALVTSFTEEEGAPLAQTAVKHLHRFGGCQGILKVFSDRLVYEAADKHDSRSWRWNDIRAVSRPDTDRIEVLTFEPQIGAPNRSFNFILKERLSERVYDLIWYQVFQPKPLIKVAER
ncbi:MAG TPA: hypothetical protein VJM12_10820 [Pyrinomonadaceae bacterium]|nr:hypothetical protein [Pyrinomonadaceae bacterium]